MSATVPAAIATLDAAPALSPADVAEILTGLAEALREEPTRILTGARVVTLVLDHAGPTLTETDLRPVWEALPVDPDGDEHAEYVARMNLVIRDLTKER